MGKENRGGIISLHQRRYRPVEIANLLSEPISTVRRAIKRCEDIGNLKDRPRIGRPVTACTPANREKIRKRMVWARGSALLVRLHWFLCQKEWKSMRKFIKIRFLKLSSIPGREITSTISRGRFNRTGHQLILRNRQLSSANSCSQMFGPKTFGLRIRQI